MEDPYCLGNHINIFFEDILKSIEYNITDNKNEILFNDKSII